MHTEPDDGDRKKKTSKSKAKGSMPKPGADSKPNISYPTVSIFQEIFYDPAYNVHFFCVLLQNFEHTVHVGFDAITGEFTVSSKH